MNAVSFFILFETIRVYKDKTKLTRVGMIGAMLSKRDGNSVGVTVDNFWAIVCTSGGVVFGGHRLGISEGSMEAIIICSLLGGPVGFVECRKDGAHDEVCQLGGADGCFEVLLAPNDG